MTRALLGRTLGHYWPSKSADAASVPPPPAGCDGPDCARSRSPARGRPGPAHRASTHPAAGGRPPPARRPAARRHTTRARPPPGLVGAARPRGPVARPAQPAGRVLADQGDQLATLGLV